MFTLSVTRHCPCHNRKTKQACYFHSFYVALACKGSNKSELIALLKLFETKKSENKKQKEKKNHHHQDTHTHIHKESYTKVTLNI